MLAVSQFTKEKVIEYAQDLMPLRFTEKIASEMKVVYAPFNNTYFVETLCIGALEYQAAGVPLVTTRVGGVPEAAGSHSLYSQHSSPDDLAEKIALVLENKVDRQAMIDTGIEHVKKFNYHTITKTF